MDFASPELKEAPALSFKAGGIPLEIKELDESGEFEGYASTFGNVDRGKDTVMPGAFRQTLANRDIRSIKMLRDHDSTRIPGQWLGMKEDERGLKAHGRLFVRDGESTPLGLETFTLMKAGALDALSIGFRTVKASFDEQLGIRKLLELELWETSIVPFPMNELATVDAVKREFTEREVERALRDAGLPNNFAKLLTVHGYEGAKARLGSRREGGSESELAEMLRNTISAMKGI